VSSKFVANDNMRAMLIAPSQQSSTRDKDFEQADSGAVVRLGSTSLSGAHQTVDIAGDAHFALGRWVRGTVSRTTGSTTLDGKDTDSYHYLAYNGLAELPNTGELQCTIQAATAPTALFDNNATVGTVSGSARISLDDDGAHINGTLQVSAGAESATLNLDHDLDDPTGISSKGQLYGSGPGTAVGLADQGNAVPGLVVWYRAQLPGGSRYNGVARLTCTNL